MDQHFAPELFAGTSKTITFYKGFDVIGYHIKNTAKTTVFEHVTRYLLVSGEPVQQIATCSKTVVFTVFYR